jgi:hypothetical protein
MNVKDAAVRAGRSFVQASVVAAGAFLASVAASGQLVAFQTNFQVFEFAECLALGYAVVSFGQNLLEDNSNVPTVK